MISLIVFLGNIGKEYEKTRHNAAWIAADQSKIFKDVAWQRKFRSSYGKMPLSATGGKVVHLIKPETFMNLSGEAVSEAASFFKIPSEEILVVHDELELSTAAVSLKWAGGLGGHNGLRSIKSSLGTADFWRIRIGIDRPVPKKVEPQPNIAGYVLAPFSVREMELLHISMEALDRLFSLIILEQKDPQSLLAAWHKVLPQSS